MEKDLEKCQKKGGGGNGVSEGRRLRRVTSYGTALASMIRKERFKSTHSSVFAGFL